MILHKSIKGGLFFQIFFFQFQWCVWVLSMCESRTCFVFQRRVSGSREMRRWQKVWMFNTEISLKNKKCEPAADVHFRMKTRLGPGCVGGGRMFKCHPPPLPGAASRSYSFTTLHLLEQVEFGLDSPPCGRVDVGLTLVRSEISSARHACPKRSFLY